MTAGRFGASSALSASLERTTGFGPRPPSCGVQQVGSYLGYSGRGANAFGKAARDPFRTCPLMQIILSTALPN
jgi:hypothetical protein